MKPPGKRPKFVEPSPPPPTPTPSQSKNPSALLILGQRLPSLLKDNLPGQMCSICLAQGEPNSSTYSLAEKLTTFLLDHPTHHSLVLLTDFPWASMGLEVTTNFINLLVSTTGNVCARHHSHPSFRSCKFVCPNLYQDRSDLGNLVDKEALEWTQEKFEATQHLLGSMDPPAEYG